MELRVVLDTDVVVAAVASAEGASCRLLLAVFASEAALLLSTPLILEYEAVLTRAPVLRFGIAVERPGAVLRRMKL